MIPGTLTPPDKINGDTAVHQQQSQQQHPHWPAPLAITTMAGPMQTPPSSPPQAIERFGYVFILLYKPSSLQVFSFSCEF